MSEGACVVIGAGPGNGQAIARRFAAAGHPVAVCARDVERLEAMAAELPGARAYAYDVRDPEAPAAVFARVRAELGAPTTLVYNAGEGAFQSLDEADVESLQAAWEVNARGLFLAAKETVADMRDAGGGNLVVIGATASLRGGARTLPFASAKAAQRSLAQSLARKLGPEGVHVSYVVLDGVVDLARTRDAMPDRPDEFFLSPAEIAEAVWFLAQQDRSAWTFELDLRPFGERW